MTDRRRQQRAAFALLLGAAALALPLSGVVLFGGLDVEDPEPAYWFLGAVSVQDFLPVLMLVGALGLVVASIGRAGERSGLATLAAGVVAVAGATLAVAHLGAAWALRAHGPFGLDESGDAAGWTTVRIATVASLAMPGALCGWVAVQAGLWIGERKRVVAR